jgi:hypothetical protein
VSHNEEAIPRRTSVTYGVSHDEAKGFIIPGLSVQITCTVDHTTPTVFDREPDPAWRHIDAAGHGHFAQPEGETVTYPTLEWAESGHTYDDGDPVMERRCPQCGERVKPGMRQARSRPLSRRMKYELSIGRPEGAHLGETVYELPSDRWKKFCDDVMAVAESAVEGLMPASISLG